MTDTRTSAVTAYIRPLTEDEVTALHDLADKGPMHCDCESSPELCHCSTIMMLCDEWKALRRPAQRAPTLEERELFAAATKINLVDAIKHIRNWTSYIDDHHRQKYADLIEAQAKLIAHFVNDGPTQTAGGCTCQDQHRRGYCTEPGCPYALSSTVQNDVENTGGGAS